MVIENQIEFRIPTASNVFSFTWQWYFSKFVTVALSDSQVGLPRGAWIRIAFARLWLRFFYAVAEVVLDNAAFSLVTDRVRSLSAATAGDRAEGPIGGYPRIFRGSIGLFFRHGVFIT